MKFIAFYLPQFHEIPENNNFWGKGFTEWTNVRKAVPLYKNHHQPRLPTELGFYDLNNDSVRYKQAELANTYGVDAWCYYYYRFNGKRVLEMPLNKHFQDKNLNMKFLICWANENWTRKWDGSDKDILIEQNHNFEDDLNFIKDVAPMLADDRYLKINNKPVLLIYRTELWQNMNKTVEIWRNYMRQNYNLEIYLVRCHDRTYKTKPVDINFDAAYQFAPFNVMIKKYGFLRTSNPKREVFVGFYDSWKEAVKDHSDFKLFRGVMTHFDNTPRKLNGVLFYGSNPNEYRKWLDAAVKYTKLNFEKEEQLIFINAWNEWGEGAILEPCSKWGREFLEQTLAAKLLA